jgi:hypothetical protein
VGRRGGKGCGMTKIADKLISPSGRLPPYSRDNVVEDTMTTAGFLVWAESEGEYFGGVRASDAFQAFCRLTDIDPIKLRKAMLGKGL